MSGRDKETNTATDEKTTILYLWALQPRPSDAFSQLTHASSVSPSCPHSDCLRARHICNGHVSLHPGLCLLTHWNSTRPLGSSPDSKHLPQPYLHRLLPSSHSQNWEMVFIPRQDARDRARDRALCEERAWKAYRLSALAVLPARAHAGVSVPEEEKHPPPPWLIRV